MREIVTCSCCLFITSVGMFLIPSIVITIASSTIICDNYDYIILYITIVSHYIWYLEVLGHL